MRGQILGYDASSDKGMISTSEGNRYSFTGADWRGQPAQLRNGANVDFSADGEVATEVYNLPSAQGQLGDKSPIVAGLLALFLGGLGVHKFYLGYNTEGIILLVGTVVSWILMFVIIGFFGLMVIGVISLVEAIIYLTKSPADFEETYVVNRKAWF